MKGFFDKENIEDMFYISILCDDYLYGEYITEKLKEDDWDNEDLEIPEDIVKLLKDENIDWSEINNRINVIVKDVQYNKIEKPTWMYKAEEQEDGWACYTPSTYISIIPKEEKYEKIAKLFYDLIYSTSHEATMDG